MIGLKIILFVALLLLTSAFLPQNTFVSRTVRLPTGRFLFGSPDPPKKNEAMENKNSGGMFGGMGGMGDMVEAVKKAGEMQKKIGSLTKELENMVITAQDPSGGVVVSFSGAGKPMGITISDEMLSKGSGAVSSAATYAVVEAHRSAQSAAMEKMKEVYSDMGIPMPPSA